MHFKLQNSDMLKTMLNAMTVIVDEATFTADQNGLRLRMMDPSRIAMIDLEWPKTLFEEFTCETAEKISVSLIEMRKLIKNTKDDKIEFATGELGVPKNKLRIKIIGKSTREFTMPLLDLELAEFPAPKLDLHAKTKLTVEGLKSMVEDAELVSDHVQFCVNPENLVLHAQGDLMTADITVAKGENILLDLETTEPQKVVFSLSYLISILKAATSDVVIAEMATDMPIKLSFLYNDAKITYYLAPRIEQI